MKRSLYIDAGHYFRKAFLRECAPTWHECFRPEDFLNAALLFILMTINLYLAFQ